MLWVSRSVLSVAICLFGSALAHARTWTDASGHYTVEADAVAFNDQMVVLKKTNGELIGIAIKELSAKDQEYVKSKETAEKLGKSAEELQTWTTKDGMKFRGRVVAYGRKDLIVQRRLGKVRFDDTPFDKIDALHQRVLLKIMSHLNETQLTDEKELEQWGKSLGAEPRKYTLEGVRMQLESGDIIGVPFFLFSPEELAVLQPGWDRWKEQKDSEQARDHEDFLMRTAAMAYHQDRAARQQVEVVKLELLAAATGVISIWQVGLIPAQGNYAPPFTVMVPAQNSDLAAAMALRSYPGYIVGGIRRANR